MGQKAEKEKGDEKYYVFPHSYYLLEFLMELKFISAAVTTITTKQFIRLYSHL